MELTDLHNRRSNINVVSDDCKLNNYPLLAWPEDKELLRLSDLPFTVNANKRRTWVTLEPKSYQILLTDDGLRAFIREGMAYGIIAVTHTGTFVQEYTVKTKAATCKL